MRILITGGSGFIGTNLVDYYLKKGDEILNLDVAPPKNPAHSKYWKNVDIVDFQKLNDEIERFKPSFVINLAAKTGTTDKGKKLDNFATNFKGVKNLVEVGKKISTIKRMIFTSTMLVCKNGYVPKSDTDYCPDTLYGKSKMMGEIVLRSEKDLPFEWVIVRPTGIWGPWFDIPYKSFFKAVQKGFYFHPKGKEVFQSLGFVGNTVYQYDKLLNISSSHVDKKTFYLADAPPVNIREWAELIKMQFGQKKVYEIPICCLKLVAKIGDLMKFFGWETPPLSSSRLENMMTSFVIDTDPLLVENLPYDLEDAVKITVKWLDYK